MPGAGVRAGRQGADAVRRLPVRRKALSRQGQNPGGQIPNPDARKDQEAVVLHKPPEIRRPRPRAPADERVARLRMPAGGLEADPAQAAAPSAGSSRTAPRSPSAASIRGSGTGSEGTRRAEAGALRASGSRTPRSAAKPGSARRADAKQNSPFALRQSATSQRPRAREPRVRPSSATAVRNQIPMPAPNRRCSFSMTDPSRRIIGAKLAAAECRVKCVLLIGAARRISGQASSCPADCGAPRTDSPAFQAARRNNLSAVRMAETCRRDQASRSEQPSVPNKCIFSRSNRRPTLSPGASGRPGAARMTKGVCDISVWKYTTDSEPSFSTISILA